MLLRVLPPDARVWAVRAGEVRAPSDVAADYARFAFLRRKRADAAGWTTSVLSQLREFAPVGGEFALRDFYAHAVAPLSAQFPENRHVEDKIRQQLQVLRDAGVVAFVGRGRYRVLV